MPNDIPSSAAGAPMRLCYRHPDAVAVRGCEGCRKAICEACVGFGPRLEGLCPACGSKQQHRGTAMAAVAVLGATLLVGGGLFWLSSMPPAVTYGEHRLDIERADARVKNAPCDGQSTLELADLLNKERDYRRTIAVVDAFDETCKPVPRLWWESYTARMQLQDHQGAINDASRLIADSPDDGDYWWWRGKARREAGDLAGAAADLEKAVEITGPKAYFSALDLVAVREQQQRPCDAVAPMAMVVRNNKDEARKQRLETWLKRLVTEGKCPDPLAAMPEKGKVAAVCATLPSSLGFTGGQADGFHTSLQNTWAARVGSMALGAPLACTAEVEEVDGGEILKDTGMRSWSARLSCAGLPSVTAQHLHVVPLKAEEELIKKLVDAGLQRWCGGT